MKSNALGIESKGAFYPSGNKKSSFSDMPGKGGRVQSLDSVPVPFGWAGWLAG